MAPHYQNAAERGMAPKEARKMDEAAGALEAWWQGVEEELLAEPPGEPEEPATKRPRKGDGPAE